MDRNKIEPLISNENTLKTSTRDFKQMKVDEMKSKHHSNNLFHEEAPLFLLKMKEELSIDLKSKFQYDEQLIEYLLEIKGLPARNYSLIYELITEAKKQFKTKHQDKKEKIFEEKETEEADLKNKFFVNNPHVRHRFFRSRNGKNYNFYEKIKKKSENLDETKKILDLQNKRIYNTPVYDKKASKYEESEHSSEENQKESFVSTKKPSQKTKKTPKKEESISKKEENSFKKQENPMETPKKEENSKEFPKNSKVKTRILGKYHPNTRNYEDIFYDPLKGSLDSNLCLSCQIAKIEILSLPCGHSCCCQDCFLKGYSVCLFCNANVKNYVFIEMMNKKGRNEEEEEFEVLEA